MYPQTRVDIATVHSTIHDIQHLSSPRFLGGGIGFSAYPIGIFGVGSMAAAFDREEYADARGLTLRGELADAILEGVTSAWRLRGEPLLLYALHGYTLIHKGKSPTPARWRNQITKARVKGTPLPKGHIVGACRFDVPTDDLERTGRCASLILGLAAPLRSSCCPSPSCRAALERPCERGGRGATLVWRANVTSGLMWFPSSASFVVQSCALDSEPDGAPAPKDSVVGAPPRLQTGRLSCGWLAESTECPGP